MKYIESRKKLIKMPNEVYRKKGKVVVETVPNIQIEIDQVFIVKREEREVNDISGYQKGEVRGNHRVLEIKPEENIVVFVNNTKYKKYLKYKNNA